MSCRRCLVSGALLSLCALTAPRVSAASDLDAALCGPPSAADEPEKLSRLQADMPPIADQSPAGWCYAFATTALINHYIHTVNGTPYDHAHMISPIDAVAAHRYYDDSNREASLSHPVGRIDLKHGGQAIDVLTGIQDQPAVRSLAQVGFT